jgi:hypothetical protein
LESQSEAGLRAGDPQPDEAGGEGDEQNPAVFFIGIFSFCVWENALLPPLKRKLCVERVTIL